MISYRLDPEMLEPFLPPGCRLDLIDGHAFASLVAFDFTDTRVMGIRWPGFVNFPEINLRFYVRHHDGVAAHRGVCFIREYVPQRIVATLARWIYNEPYAVAPMKSRVKVEAETIEVEHAISLHGKSQTIQVTGSTHSICPEPDSIESFFKEQQWGFGTSRRGQLIRYQVLHPTWNIHPVKSFKLDWDWNAIYGPHWASLQQMQPMSTVLAEGSAVQVFPHGVHTVPRHAAGVI